MRGSAWLAGASWSPSFLILRAIRESLKRIDAVHIEALSPDPAQPPRMAIWLAAWLAGQLGWNPHRPAGEFRP